MDSPIQPTGRAVSHPKRSSRSTHVPTVDVGLSFNCRLPGTWYMNSRCSPTCAKRGSQGTSRWRNPLRRRLFSTLSPPRSIAPLKEILTKGSDMKDALFNGRQRAGEPSPTTPRRHTDDPLDMLVYRPKRTTCLRCGEAFDSYDPRYNRRCALCTKSVQGHDDRYNY